MRTHRLKGPGTERRKGIDGTEKDVRVIIPSGCKDSVRNIIYFSFCMCVIIVPPKFETKRIRGVHPQEKKSGKPKNEYLSYRTLSPPLPPNFNVDFVVLFFVSSCGVGHS